MNFKLISAARNLRSEHRPLHHQKLTTVLRILEVPGKYARRGVPVYSDLMPSESDLWQWLDTSKRNHRRLIRQHHPDKGGCHDYAAMINAAWDRVQELIARRGVSYAT